jgi:hypothetical protein
MSPSKKLCNNNDYFSEKDAFDLIEVKVDKFINFQSLKDHNFFELLLFLSGEGVFEINGISHVISPGTFCFLTPFHLSQLTVKNTLPIKYMSCKFDWSYLSKELNYPIPQIKQINHFLSIKPYVHCNSDEFAYVLGVFEQLYNEFKQQDIFSSLFIKTYVQSLCHSHASFSKKYNHIAEKASLNI